MQPPPRKGNYAKFLKNLHSEQINKLLAKNQHECELLEDIRTFIVKRCAIEKSYSEALLKMSSAYLNKKIPNIPDIKLDGGDEKWNMWNVWRTVLEENEKLARARLAAVEVFQQQIAEEAKVLRAHKVGAAKKSVDQLGLVQKELQLCVADVDRTKKLYFDEEHCAHDVRDKARDIEEKLKKKKGSFFQSITSLQKNSAKFSSKREQLEEKSAGARNDYLLCLAAANAHQNRYFLVDLQLCMTSMESNVFDKVAEYLMLMGRTELLTCSAMQNSFTTIRDQAKQLTREYNLQCLYLYYPVLKQHIQYEFEPCDNDPIDHISAEHEAAAATLSKEARRWATKIARENNNIKDCMRKLQIYTQLRETGTKDPNDQNGPDLDTKIEDMRQSIRRSETAKMKAEARIEYLRVGGVNVDEWLQEAESLNVQDIQRSASSLSDHPSSDSFYDSDFADGEPSVPPVVDVKVEKDYDEKMLQQQQHSHHDDDDSVHEADAMLEQERMRIEQMTAGWDDPTQVDWGTDDTLDAHETVDSTGQSSGPVLKCTALYSYTAQNPDELTIVENEQLEVVGEGDGDGWLRARNYRGEEGYVPHNYLDVEREQPEGLQTSGSGLVNQISFSSVDYTIDNEDATTDTANQSPDQVSVIAAPLATPAPADVYHPQKTEYCIALYDYEGEGTEELTFDEGQVIRIVSKIAHSIDDGWWKGEFDGKIGNFPSLVVEECDEFGEPLEKEDETPPASAPPVFTPPEVPEHLIEDFEAYEVEDEDGGGPPGGPPPAAPPPQLPPSENGVEDQSEIDGKFSMEMPNRQHKQYDTQFNPYVPHTEVPDVVVLTETEQIVEDPPIDPPHTKQPPQYNQKQSKQSSSSDDALGVAQIVITAATPMMEEPEQPFPPPEDETPAIEEELAAVPEEEEDEEEEGIAEEFRTKHEQQSNLSDEDQVEDLPTDSAPFPVSSSSGDGDTTGPSTAENSVSHNVAASGGGAVGGETACGSGDEPSPNKQVVGGRASIPDELEPDQLARLQELKESNA